jgi:hypothetical protein
MGVCYLRVLCGADPHHIRALAEALGRRPPANCYSPDRSHHSYFGTDPKITVANREYAARYRPRCGIGATAAPFSSTGYHLHV